MEQGLKLLTLLAAMLLSAIPASAYDFFEVNGIYYITSGDSDATCAVWRGANYYSGNVVILSSVTYNGKTYTVTSIGVQSFCYCTGLTSVTIGNSVTSIGGNAFAYCTALSRLQSNALVPPTCGIDAFSDIDKSKCELIVPDEAINAYKEADQWKEFLLISNTNEITIPTGSQLDQILAGQVEVYDLNGSLLKVVEQPATLDNALEGLPHNAYILRGNGTSLKVLKQ